MLDFETKGSLKTGVLILIYLLILAISCEYLDRDFEFHGITLWVVQVTSCLMVAKTLPNCFGEPLDVYLFVFSFFLLLPFLVLSHYLGSNLFTTLTLTFANLALILHYLIVYSFKEFQASTSFQFCQYPMSPNRQIRYSILISLTLAVFVLTFTDLHISFASFEELYQNRAQQTSSLLNYTWVAYILNWTTIVILPSALLLAVVTRSVKFIFVLFPFFVFFYMVTYQKWTLASYSLVLFLGLYIYFEQARTKFSFRTSVFAYFLVSLNLISLFLSSSSDRLIFVDLIVRRAILDPSTMFSYYFLYSLSNPKLLWSDTIVARFLGSEISESGSIRVGMRFFNQPSMYFLQRPPTMNATAGSVADSILQGGVFGLFFISIFLGLLLKLAGKITYQIEFCYVFGYAFIFSILCIHSPLNNVFSSSGGFLLLFFLILAPRIKNKGNKSSV